MRRVFLIGLLLGGVVLAAGCGGGSGLVPVSGRVTLDGKPVKDMIVNFQAVNETKGTGAIGMTDADGRFTLSDMRGGAGAYPGDYKVSFYPSLGSKKQDEAADVVSVGPRGGLPAIYLDASRTPLQVNIPEGGGTFDVLLTRSGKGATIKPAPPLDAR